MSWGAPSKSRGLESEWIGEETEQDEDGFAFGVGPGGSKYEKLKSPAPSKKKNYFPRGTLGLSLASDSIPSIRLNLSSWNNIPEERRTHLLSLV